MFYCFLYSLLISYTGPVFLYFLPPLLLPFFWVIIIKHDVVKEFSYCKPVIFIKDYAMKKILVLIIALAAAIAGGYFAATSFFTSSWEGTWWGVQDAGLNWSGDNIKILETFTFTSNGDSIIVDQKVQRGARELTGDLSGTAVRDGGRLTITPADGSSPVSFSFNRMNHTIETSLTNADGTPVVLKKVSDSDSAEIEKIRSEIVRTAQNPANAIDTTISHDDNE